MKIWVLTILMVRAKLEQFAEMIDERVEKFSLDMVTPTSELYEKIVFWNDIKRRVVNANVLAERILNVLSEGERKICLMYASGISMQDIAESEKISKSSVSRKITYCCKIGAIVLCGLGYNENKLQADYFDIEIVARTYKKLGRLLSSGASRHSSDIAKENSEIKNVEKEIVNSGLIVKFNPPNSASGAERINSACV